MPTLPQGGTLPPQVEITSQPGRTWYIDKSTNRIRGDCDNWLAVRQAVEIILNVQRFRWQIYTPYSGMDWRNLIGNDPGYVAAELQRRVREALLMDDRVLDIRDYQYTIEDDMLTASFTVVTVYGDIPQTAEVTLS